MLNLMIRKSNICSSKCQQEKNIIKIVTTATNSFSSFECNSIDFRLTFMCNLNENTMSNSGLQLGNAILLNVFMLTGKAVLFPPRGRKSHTNPVYHDVFCSGSTGRCNENLYGHNFLKLPIDALSFWSDFSVQQPLNSLTSVLGEPVTSGQL